MKIETTYQPEDLKSGTCTTCSEESEEILIADEHGRCIDCIEEQKFYDLTMQGL